MSAWSRFKIEVQLILIVGDCGCAVAELFEVVCSEPDSVTLEEVVEVFTQRDAVAFAQVRPSNHVACTC